jgi:hypothetical protein
MEKKLKRRQEDEGKQEVEEKARDEGKTRRSRSRAKLRR